MNRNFVDVMIPSGSVFTIAANLVLSSSQGTTLRICIPSAKIVEMYNEMMNEAVTPSPIPDENQQEAQTTSPPPVQSPLIPTNSNVRFVPNSPSPVQSPPPIDDGEVELRQIIREMFDSEELLRPTPRRIPAPELPNVIPFKVVTDLTEDVTTTTYYYNDGTVTSKSDGIVNAGECPICCDEFELGATCPECNYKICTDCAVRMTQTGRTQRCPGCSYNWKRGSKRLRDGSFKIN